MVEDWTNIEIQILKKIYSEDLTLEEIQEMLPNNRTVSAIKAKALRLKLERKKNSWTRKEINLLCEHYPSATKQEMQKIIPDKSYQTILVKASKLGLKKESFWSEEEDKILKKYYRSKMSYEEIMELLPGRSYTAILHRASRLKLKKGKYVPLSKESTARRWTIDEVEFVKRFYDVMPNEEILELLPDRTMSGLKYFAYKHNLSKSYNNDDNPYKIYPSWTDDEIKTLLENYNKLPTDELVKLFPNRTWGGVRSRMGILGLKRDKFVWSRKERFKPWHQDENTILKDNEGKTVDEIQKLLPHRTPLGISRHAKELGIKLCS